jgi:hypothetical protein
MVEQASSRINTEQALCSKAFCGLPLLDLNAAGSMCKTPCRLTCLVCGGLMALGCEPEFRTAQDMVEQYEEKIEEIQQEVVNGLAGLTFLGEQMMVDLKKRFNRRLNRMGMAWIEEWNRLVHLRCTKKALCDCLLPLGVSECKKHKKSIPKPRPPATTPRMKPAPSPAPQVVAKESQRHPTGLVLAGPQSKASWLRKPTSDVCIPVANQYEPCRAVKAKSKPDTRKPNLALQLAAKGCARLNTSGALLPALPSGPVAHTVQTCTRKRDLRLEAASKDNTKLDAWVGSTTAQPIVQDAKRPKKIHQESAPFITKNADRPLFNKAAYMNSFDPTLHGYIRKNGVEIFRFPDGHEEQVFSPVNELTDDGHLLPK